MSTALISRLQQVSSAYKLSLIHISVKIDGKEYPLSDTDFPTVDQNAPHLLREDEVRLMEQLKAGFQRSEKLQKHIKFLYSKGGLYKCFNGNLLYHGCIPMEEDGSFTEFELQGEKLSGKALMDHCLLYTSRCV